MAKKPIVGTEGYKPERTEQRGYKPVSPSYIPSGDPKPHGGYQPTNSGENPSNRPTPPGDE